MEEVKITLTEIARQIVAQHPLTVCKETAHENGDTTWTPEEIPPAFSITTNT